MTSTPSTLEAAPSRETHAQVRVAGLTVRFGQLEAARDLDLTLRPGEIVSVVGPSGCGKSTLLRAIAGLVAIDAGEISIGGRTVAREGRWVPTEDRGVGVVFQDHALFPHLTVHDNVAFGLHRSGEREERVAEVLELVGLGPLSRRYPHELSGGEQQRVALARALAPRPALVLLDEPFSSLDRRLRDQVREDTVRLLRREGATALFVTHDQLEALAVGDRVAVMRAGRLEQIDAPETVFHAPSSRFVAEFMGEADFLRARQDGRHAQTRFGGVEVAGAPDQRELEVMVRPHEVALESDPKGDARVLETEFRGGLVAHRVTSDDGVEVSALRQHTQVLPPGTRVRVAIRAGHPLAAFDAPTTAGPADR